MAKTDFGMEQVTKYLKLIDRRMYIMMHSGADWKPEYGQELEEIDREISVLRELMDSGQEQDEYQDDFRQTDSGQVSCEDYFRIKFAFFRLHGDRCVFTFRIDEHGVPTREYAFLDGSVWHECISDASMISPVSENGERVLKKFSFHKIEFWDSACGKFRHCFYEF